MNSLSQYLSGTKKIIFDIFQDMKPLENKYFLTRWCFYIIWGIFLLILAAIEMYGPQIIKMLEAQLDPNTICNTIGLCEKLSTWKAPAKCTEPKMIGMCRALVPSELFLKS